MNSIEDSSMSLSHDHISLARRLKEIEEMSMEQIYRLEEVKANDF